MPGRLLFVTERFSPDIGGVARSSARIAASLAAVARGRSGVSRAEGHDVGDAEVDGSDRVGEFDGVDVLAWTRTLAPGTMESSSLEVAAGTLTVHRMGLFGNWDVSMQHTLNALEWLHQRADYGAVWGHYVFPAGFLGVFFAERMGLPSIVSARGNDIDRLMFPPGDFARLRWTLERASVVTAVSRDLAAKIDVLLGRRGHAVAIPNVVDSEVFRPDGQLERHESRRAGEFGDSHGSDAALRAALGILPDESVLGFSGELRHKKGTPFLLAALSEVRRVKPACLLIIGAVRAREQAQLAGFEAAAPDDAARIIVTGHLDQADAVARHLRLCDVVLQPSIWDGMPNSVLEAMACERVVLASDAGGIPELIRPGLDGYLVPRASLHRLGEATLEILALSAAERKAIGAAARRRMMGEFHPARERATLAALLRRIGGLSRDCDRL